LVIGEPLPEQAHRAYSHGVMIPELAIRPCRLEDVGAICDVINSASVAYAGVIPTDRFRTPYMPQEELEQEIDAGVRFWGWYNGLGRVWPAQATAHTEPPRPDIACGTLVGVMGVQEVDDATLIRHAYVLPAHQRQGIGKRLLAQLTTQARDPLYVGTWADATWAVRFYQRNGFELVAPARKDELLQRYWSIPQRQIDTSVVLQRAKTTGGAGGPELPMP
jgi:GNAT superfamily N-acetyltransferase